MTDRPGRRTGQQGRTELTALTDDELYAQAEQYGVSRTNDDGTERTREEVVNELANKQRQATRQAERGKGGGGGGDEGTEEEETEPTAGV